MKANNTKVLINTGGSFTGGSAKRDSGILSRTSEIARLRDAGEKYTQDISKTTELINSIESDIQKEMDILRQTEQEKEILLVLSRSQFAALDNANAKYED